MDQTGVMCAAASLAYFTIGKQVPLSTSHPVAIVTALGCYAMPRVYTYLAQTIAVDAKSPRTAIGLMDGVMATAGPIALSVVTSYAVARYMNV